MRKRWTDEKKCQVLNEVGLVWELFHVKQSTSSLMKQATTTGARREDALAKLVERLSSSSILILNNNTLHLQKIEDNKEDSKWKKIAATTEAKVNLPKNLLSTAFFRGGEGGKKLCYEDKSEARGNNYYITGEAVYTRLPSCRRTGNM